MIEAATEDERVKAGLFADLDRIVLRHDAILASNTSFLSDPGFRGESVSGFCAVTGKPCLCGRARNGWSTNGRFGTTPQLALASISSPVDEGARIYCG